MQLGYYKFIIQTFSHLFVPLSGDFWVVDLEMVKFCFSTKDDRCSYLCAAAVGEALDGETRWGDTRAGDFRLLRFEEGLISLR